MSCCSRVATVEAERHADGTAAALHAGTSSQDRPDARSTTLFQPIQSAIQSVIEVSLHWLAPTSLLHCAQDRPSGERVTSGQPPDDGVERVTTFLHPGHVFASRTPSAVTTILGSCVAICLHDSVNGLGGINHFVLPHWAGEGEQSTRFGNVAVAQLIESLEALGSRRSCLEAKVFGGASVLGGEATSAGRLSERNVVVAHEELEFAGIAVVASDTGGVKGRKLIFHTDSGTAWVRRL